MLRSARSALGRYGAPVAGALGIGGLAGGAYALGRGQDSADQPRDQIGRFGSGGGAKPNHEQALARQAIFKRNRQRTFNAGFIGTLPLGGLGGLAANIGGEKRYAKRMATPLNERQVRWVNKRLARGLPVSNRYAAERMSGLRDSADLPRPREGLSPAARGLVYTGGSPLGALAGTMARSPEWDAYRAQQKEKHKAVRRAAVVAGLGSVTAAAVAPGIARGAARMGAQNFVRRAVRM
jgi:hypothetical protein